MKKETIRGRGIIISMDFLLRAFLSRPLDVLQRSMEEKTLGRAPEPLFFTKARGTGLGQAVVEKIILEYGEAVKFKRKESAGTRVSVILPEAGPS